MREVRGLERSEKEREEEGETRAEKEAERRITERHGKTAASSCHIGEKVAMQRGRKEEKRREERTRHKGKR